MSLVPAAASKASSVSSGIEPLQGQGRRTHETNSPSRPLQVKAEFGRESNG